MNIQYYKSVLSENKHDMKKNMVHIKTIYWKTKCQKFASFIFN